MISEDSFILALGLMGVVQLVVLFAVLRLYRIADDTSVLRRAVERWEQREAERIRAAGES